MPRPDAKKHNPDPLYLRNLVARSGLSQRECARRIGISDRMMRAYLAVDAKPTPAPYPVQFALENLTEEQPNVL